MLEYGQIQNKKNKATIQISVSRLYEKRRGQKIKQSGGKDCFLKQNMINSEKRNAGGEAAMEEKKKRREEKRKEEKRKEEKKKKIKRER